MEILELDSIVELHSIKHMLKPKPSIDSLVINQTKTNAEFCKVLLSRPLSTCSSPNPLREMRKAEAQENNLKSNGDDTIHNRKLESNGGAIEG